MKLWTRCWRSRIVMNESWSRADTYDREIYRFLGSWSMQIGVNWHLKLRMRFSQLTSHWRCREVKQRSRARPTMCHYVPVDFGTSGGSDGGVICRHPNCCLRCHLEEVPGGVDGGLGARRRSFDGWLRCGGVRWSGMNCS